MGINKKPEQIIKRLIELYFEFSDIDLTDKEEEKLGSILYKSYRKMSEDKLKEHYKNCLIAITVFNKNPFGNNYIESIASPSLSDSKTTPILKQENKSIFQAEALKDILDDVFMDVSTHTTASLKEIIENLIENSESYGASKEEKKVLKYLNGPEFWGEVNDLENLNKITLKDLLTIINQNT